MDLTLRDEIKSAYPLTLQEHPSSSYIERTYENAQKSDVTLAFAIDFSTAGERCTSKAAGTKFIAIPFTWEAKRAAGHVRRHMYEKNAKRINIAGNGIYTFSAYGYDQKTVNEKIYQILKIVHQEFPIAHVRSGGQTGVDSAGLVAGMLLNIPTLGFFPKGFRQRVENGQDITQSHQDILLKLEEQAEELRASETWK